MAGYSPTGVVGAPISDPNFFETLREQRGWYRDVLRSLRIKFEKQRQQFEDQEKLYIDSIQKLEDALDILAKPYLTTEEVGRVFGAFQETKPNFI